jgi:hypothetical protein
METEQALIWWQVKMILNWPNENYTRANSRLILFPGRDKRLGHLDIVVIEIIYHRILDGCKQFASYCGRR